MKKILIIMLIACGVIRAQAQVDDGFHYNSVVRTPAGELLVNKVLTYRFSVLRGSATGEAVYSETREAATNSRGQMHLVIGLGEPEQFSAIDWSRGPYFMKTEMNPGDGFATLSVQELLSVPYALSAGTAATVERTSPDGTIRRLQVDNAGQLSTAPVVDATIPIPAGYTRLAFHDEFDGTGLPDPTKWSYEEGYLRNGEMQYYTAGRIENCFRSEGCLHIRTLNDSLLVKDAIISLWPTVKKDTIVPVTSASIHTRYKAAWKYCRVEVRAKLPLCSGTWPAIWMMPENDVHGYWPSSGEIDIMEHVGNDPNHVHFTLHSAKYNWMENNAPTYSVNCYNVNTQFHIFAMEWREGGIEFFVDGVRKYRVLKQYTDTWAEWPFEELFYLILNTGFGGGWGGRDGTDLKGLPQDYIIDYVRVFQ
jgi:beta-glucanase (GH16 family)